MKKIPLLHPARRALRRGMTLTELMIAMSLSVVVAGAATWFLVESTRTSLRTLSNVDNDLEQWSISNRLLIDSKLANAVTVYNKFEKTSFDSATGLGPGERGNFLVLSQSDPKAGTTTSQFRFVWGYVYDSTAKTLSRFEFDIVKDGGSDYTDCTALVDILKNHYTAISLKQKVVAKDVTLVDSGVEAFLVREKGRQANLVFRRESGKHKKTRDVRMFEISFYTRK